MITAIKEYLAAMAAKARFEVMTQACYAAIGYAVERRNAAEQDGLALDDQELERLQMEYLRGYCPDLKHPERDLASLRARMHGVGVKPGEKI